MTAVQADLNAVGPPGLESFLGVVVPAVDDLCEEQQSLFIPCELEFRIIAVSAIPEMSVSGVAFSVAELSKDGHILPLAVLRIHRNGGFVGNAAQAQGTFGIIRLVDPGPFQKRGNPVAFCPPENAVVLADIRFCGIKGILGITAERTENQFPFLPRFQDKIGRGRLESPFFVGFPFRSDIAVSAGTHEIRLDAAAELLPGIVFHRDPDFR